jgi:uncharacterized protein
MKFIQQMKKSFKRLFRVFWIFLALVIVFIGYCYLETYLLTTRQITIHSKDLPDSFDGFRIVFVSDIHHGPYFSLNRVKDLVSKINALNPDAIILGGDYSHRDPKYIKPFFDEIQNLHAKYGIYGVLGNHDHWEGAELTLSLMERNGIYICDNKSYWLNNGSDSIKIGGVGDLWEDVQIPDSTLHDVKPSDFCILISHNPDYLENLDKEKIDLTLSGHTHGGQISVFGLWSPVLPSKYGQKYSYGLMKFDNCQSYITSGIGTITPPLRFCMRPEFVVITLEK